MESATARRPRVTARATLAAVIGAGFGVVCAAVAAAIPPSAWGVMVYGVPVGAVVGAAAGLCVWAGARALFRVGARVTPLLAWASSVSCAALASAAAVVLGLSGLEVSRVAATAVIGAVLGATGSVADNLWSTGAARRS